jgi:hypothetical protein
MAKRGRTSTASLEVAALVAPVAKENRLSPPIHLSDAEQGIWLDVVNDNPADTFSAMHIPLLEAYCRHVVNGRVLAEEISNFDRSWLYGADGADSDASLKRYDRMLAMAERESRAASSLATRLRITRQAVEHPTTAGRALNNKAKARKPWQLPADVED